jgi:hypothetical protein
MLYHHDFDQISCACKLDKLDIRLHLQQQVSYEPSSLIDIEGVILILLRLISHLVRFLREA